MKEFTKDLKKIAVRNNIAIMLLSEISEDTDHRVDHRPTVNDFKGIDAEATCDNLLYIFREDYYNEYTVNRNIMEVTSLKNAHKENGTCSLAYLPEYYKIAGLDQKTLLTILVFSDIVL